MITDASRYYGCVLHSIAERADRHVIVRRICEDIPGFYLVNGALPVYIKYSTSRKGPWNFNFLIAHQERLTSLFETYGESIVTFVCGRDGIAALSYPEFRKVLDDNFEQQEGVSIRRRLNEMYQVRGRDGKLDRRVSRSSLSELLDNHYSRLART